jgi:hypothetical protein
MGYTPLLFCEMSDMLGAAQELISIRHDFSDAIGRQVVATAGLISKHFYPISTSLFDLSGTTCVRWPGKTLSCFP